MGKTCFVTMPKHFRAIVQRVGKRHVKQQVARAYSLTRTIVDLCYRKMSA